MRQDYREAKGLRATKVLKAPKVTQLQGRQKSTRPPKGDTGAQDTHGVQGPKGDTGAQGPPGTNGPPGPKGDSSAIKPSHTAKDVFQCLMNDLNELSTEDGVNVIISTT